MKKKSVSRICLSLLMGASICMSGFDHESGVQTNLFCELDERGAASSEKRALSVAVDGVIERFGSSAVGYGRSMRFDHDVVRRDKYS